MDFESIMRIEEAFGATSSFYFMATDRDVHRFRYRIEDMEGRMGAIADRGFEVGLHGGYYSYDDPAAIVHEKKRLEKVLNKKVIGYRNHYLMFKIPETWEYLAQAGFRYDATIGNNRIIGFKNGLCHAFRPFNYHTGEGIDLIELPMVLGDFTLLGSGLSPKRAWEVAKSLIDNVERDNGVATLLWHSDVFNASFRKDWVRLYVKVLEYCRSKNAWMTSGDNVSEWIRKAY
jgi:peptidoglycan/xylan/chitin deacetylase (PgdA/CDA1 family)